MQSSMRLYLLYHLLVDDKPEGYLFIYVLLAHDVRVAVKVCNQLAVAGAT